MRSAFTWPRLTRPLALTVLTASSLAGAADPVTSTPYDRFVEDGRALQFLRIARRAYAASVAGREILLATPSPGVKRPAGPRDEPPPPEWPAGPVGMLLCVEDDRAIQGCQGVISPETRSMSRLATGLGEGLAAGGSRGRRSIPREADLSGSRIVAWFVLPLEEMTYRQLKAAVKAGEVDTAATGFMVPGPEGDLFIAPGEAVTAGAVARIARKGGAAGIFRRPGRIVLLRPVPAGEPLEVIP